MVLYLYFVKLLVMKAVITVIEINFNFGPKKNDNYFSNRSIMQYTLFENSK
jgi:hypothetical protein